MQHVLPLGGGRPLATVAAGPSDVGVRALPRRIPPLNPNRATKNMLEADGTPAAVQLPWSSQPITQAGSPTAAVRREAAGATSAMIGEQQLHAHAGKQCVYHDESGGGEVVLMPAGGAVPHARPVRGAVAGLGVVEDRRRTAVGLHGASEALPLPAPTGRAAVRGRRLLRCMSPQQARPGGRRLSAVAATEQHAAPRGGRRLSAVAAPPAEEQPQLGRRKSVGNMYHDLVSGSVLASQNTSAQAASIMGHEGEMPETRERRGLKRGECARSDALTVHAAHSPQRGGTPQRRRKQVGSPRASDVLRQEPDGIKPVDGAETKPGCDPQGRRMGVRVRHFTAHTGDASDVQSHPRKYKFGKHTYPEQHAVEFPGLAPTTGNRPAERPGQNKMQGVRVCHRMSPSPRAAGEHHAVLPHFPAAVLPHLQAAEA